MLTHFVIHDGGNQTITGVAVDENQEVKRASSATYTIVNLRHHEDSSDRVVVASTSATLDGTSTTTDAAAGRGTANPRKLSLTSTTGFTEGKAYLITNSDGRSEMFRVDHKDSSNENVYADQELGQTYSSGATVQGIELSATFPSAEASDDVEFDADVHYAIDWNFWGVTPAYRRDLIRVRRSAPRPYATVEDVQILDATIAAYSGDRFDIKRCLEQAHRDFRRVLRERDIDPDTYNGAETARDAVAYRAAQLARTQMGGDRDQDLANGYGAEFASILTNLGSHGEVLTDRQDDDERFDLAEKLAPFGLT